MTIKSKRPNPFGTDTAQSFDPATASTVISPATTSYVVPPPGGVVIAAATTSLAALQGSAGLTASTAIAKLTAVGGVAGDPIVYTLGGTGAGSFTLTTSNSVGTLSTGSSGVAGGANGKLYALTLTATDTTTGLSSTASAFDVVVASSVGDTVPLATLFGSTGAASPAFIYGLAGNDTLNASGLTGKLFFDGGAGADTMTGGTGVNRYLYSATGDSTASAMDIINNFAANKDYIDLTGIGSAKLIFGGAISGTTLAAGTIGYKISGSQTNLYVNSSGASEALTATNMKIGLLGAPVIGTLNVLHN